METKSLWRHIRLSVYRVYILVVSSESTTETETTMGTTILLGIVQGQL